MPEVTDLTARYQLEQLLNWTGSARTFRGQHPDTGEAVAVKLLSLSRTPAAPALARRFESTVDVLRTLRHPALPRILEHGLTSGNDAFLVSAWVEGDPLPDAGPIDPAFLLPVLLQVVEALETLSLHGLVHLNLRPDNVLVDAAGRATLVGWGTSLLTVDWQSSVRPSADGSTSEFAAPEVHRSHAAGDALWRADLYSVAAIATRLLGALLAPRGEGPPHLKLPRPTSGSLHDPGQLRSVLERCLAPDPAARPDSYVELARGLQHAMPRVTASVAETQPIAALRLAGGRGGSLAGPMPVALVAEQPQAPAAHAVIMSAASPISPPHVPRGPTAMSQDDDARDAQNAAGKPPSARPADREGTWGGYDPDKTMLGIDAASIEQAIAAKKAEADQAAQTAQQAATRPPEAKEPSTNPIDPNKLRDEVEESPEGGAPTLLGIDPRSLGFDPEKTMLGIDPSATLLGLPPSATPAPPVPAVESTMAVPLPARPAAPAAPPAIEDTEETGASGDKTVFFQRPAHLGTPVPGASAPAAADHTMAGPLPPAGPPAPAPAATDGTVILPLPAAAPGAGAPAAKPGPKSVDRTVVMAAPAASAPLSPPVPKTPPAPVDRTVVMSPAAKPAAPPTAAPPPAAPPAAKAAPPPEAPVPAKPAPAPAAPPAAPPVAAPAPKPAPPKPAAKPAAKPAPAASAIADTPAAATPAAAASPAVAAPAQPGKRSLTWLWITIPVVGLLIILAVVAVVAIRVVPGLLDRDEPPAPVVAEPPPPVVETVAEELPEELPATEPPELLEARDLLGQGQALQARQRLDAISETMESTEVPPAPELYEAYRLLRDEILVARRDQLAGAMRSAWSSRNLASLRQVLRGIAPEEEQALAAVPELKSLLDRTRAATRALARGESTLQGGDPIAALVLARAFDSEYRDLAGAWDLRERAASQIERSVDELIGTGQLEEAESRLARLRELWTDRAGLSGRQQRIQGLRQSQARWDTLLASIEQTAEAGRLHEALGMFDGVDVPERYRDRFEALQQRTRQAFQAADQQPPSVTLASAADVEYRRNEPITIELLVRDDYAVVGVTLQARPARGQFQAVELQKVSADRYRAEIPVSVHANERNVEIWAEATDHSGHTTRIGSAQQPIEIRRGRGVRG